MSKSIEHLIAIFLLILQLVNRNCLEKVKAHPEMIQSRDIQQAWKRRSDMQEEGRHLKSEIYIGSIIPNSLWLSQMAEEYSQVMDKGFLKFKVGLDLCLI